LSAQFSERQKKLISEQKLKIESVPSNENTGLNPFMPSIDITEDMREQQKLFHTDVTPPMKGGGDLLDRDSIGSSSLKF
jgi:hypothetical protein